MHQVDWVARWGGLVADREEAAHKDGGHSDPRYWDRRAPTFARSTTGRTEQFLEVVRPFVSARTTVIDVGAGAGRHAVPLAERAEWVTAVEPSEGMRAHIPALPNLTVIASAWEDAQVAPADVVICSHVLYGVADVVPFVEKMERAARARVFIMLREGPVPHPANVLRDKIGSAPLPPIPRFSDLFMVLIQLGITPDVRFISYPTISASHTRRWASSTRPSPTASRCSAMGGTRSTARGAWLRCWCATVTSSSTTAAFRFQGSHIGNPA